MIQRRSGLPLTSRNKTWLKDRVDPEWVYGHDAWTTPLAT
jgi:salicylate hydroxylase/6-hydroxynicotinate 3-monooxygenase